MLLFLSFIQPDSLLNLDRTISSRCPQAHVRASLLARGPVPSPLRPILTTFLFLFSPSPWSALLHVFLAFHQQHPCTLARSSPRFVLGARQGCDALGRTVPFAGSRAIAARATRCGAADGGEGAPSSVRAVLFEDGRVPCFAYSGVLGAIPVYAEPGR